MRNPLRPFAPFPYPPGQWYSPLDAVAEARGRDLVDRAVNEDRAFVRLTDALARLIDDRARAELALKKAVHGAFEARLRTLALRADPAPQHGFGRLALPAEEHPLDFWLAPGLGLECRPPSFASRLWHQVELITLAIALVGRAIWIGCRFASWRVTPRLCRMLALNAWPEARWIAINDALVARAGFRPNDLLAEVNASALGDFATLPTIRLDDARVQLCSWFSRAVFRSACLALASIAIGVGRRPKVVEGSIQLLRIANRALDARRLVGAVKFDMCIDNMEYDPQHILIGALAPGARMVRLPHSEMDTPGVALSYLAYDLFFSGGAYQYASFSASWFKNARNVPVGTLQSDRRIRTALHTDLDYKTRIEAELAKGRRLVVVFGPSDIAGIWAHFVRQLEIVLDVAAAHDDWFVVIKPKYDDQLYAAAEREIGLSRKLLGERVLCLHYPVPGQEVCSAGYLVDKMTLGIAVGGSVVIEALCHGRAIMMVYPVAGETPLRRKLVECGLLHTDDDKFGRELRIFLSQPTRATIPFDWFRERFDAFGDDRCLDRFAETLGRTGVPSAPLVPAVAEMA